MRGFVALLAVLVACEQGPPAPETHAAPPALAKPAPPPVTPPPLPPTPPPVATPSPPPPPPVKRPHTQTRRNVQLDDALPKHGIALHEYGMGGDDLVVIDADAKTLHYVEHPMFADRKPKDTTRALTAAEIARFTALADAAWRENPVGDTPRITDVASHLEIADGDDVFTANGTMFEAPWRPAAGRLVEAIANASWAREAH
jgi:hypothetical protein